MNLNSIFHLLASVTIIIFSIFVFIKNKKNIYFVFFGTAIFIWLFASYFAYVSQIESQALFWFKISYIGVIFIPSTFFHFIFNLLGRKLNKTISLNYIISLFFIFLLYFSEYFIKGLYKYTWGYYPKASFIGHPVFLLFFNSLFTMSIISIFLSFHSKTNKLSVTDKNKLKYLFIGSMIGTLGALDFFPNYGVNIYPFGFLFMMAFPAIYTYAVFRYRLMDISIVIKKTVVYSISASLLASFFILFILVMTKYLSNFAGIPSFAIISIAAFIIALFFNPVRNKIQTIIDKAFYKKTYDYYATIREVSHELASSFSLGRIYSFIGGIILSALGLKNIYFLCLVPGGKYVTIMVYSTSHEKDSMQRDKETVNKKNDPEVRTNITEKKMQESKMAIDSNSEIFPLLKTYDVVIREELPQVHKIKQEVIEKVNTDLKPFEGEAVVPVFVDNNLELLLVLSEKISGDIFSSEDIKLLHTVSDQMAVAIKNAKLYMDKLTSDRLASIGMMSATFRHEIKNPLTSIKT